MYCTCIPILLIGTYKSAVAHEVMTENISLIKSVGIGLVFLADKLLEKKIINERQKKATTDRFTGRTEDERMDDLLHFLMTSIKVEGEVFGIFLEILKEEDTLVSISLANKLLAKYRALKESLEFKKSKDVGVHRTPQSGMHVCVYTGSNIVLFANLIDSSVTIAGQELFHLQGDRPHSFVWENYGFRLHCPEGAVSKDTEVAVTALVSGSFKVPKGTVLVSAVYAISVSKPLLKQLTIKLQHCVDLKNTDQTSYLKFVRTPQESPYQFSIIDGGLFSVNSRYGSIECAQFCFFGIIKIIGYAIGLG